MIIIKRTDSVEDWKIIDNKRGFANTLEPNEDGAEETGNNSNFTVLSNGFQIGDTNGDFNANGGTYLYIAFAADASAAPALPDSFDNLLYTGTGSDQTISGYSFNLSKGSLLWVKSRNASNNWNQYDTIRGPKNRLVSNLTQAQDSSGGLDGFTSDGFTLRGGYDISQAFNYVTYAWKTNIPASNTDGTIQSVVSTNQAAGLSVVQYTGDGSASSTVGHGLGAIPDITIFKKTSGADFWHVFDTASNTVMFLNNTTAASAISGGTNGAVDIANMTSTKFGFIQGSSSVNNQNGSGSIYIVYAFKSITGFSKIGSYTGTGGNNRSITGLGFQPTLIMIKASSILSDWSVFDSSRGGNKTLAANDIAAEVTDDSNGYLSSFDADGFTTQVGSSDDVNVNNFNETYIYMAFKEN